MITWNVEVRKDGKSLLFADSFETMQEAKLYGIMWAQMNRVFGCEVITKKREANTEKCVVLYS